MKKRKESRGQRPVPPLFRIDQQPHPTEDGVSLIWLESAFDKDAAVGVLESNASATGIALGQIYYGPSLFLNYNDPTVAPHAGHHRDPECRCYVLWQPCETGRARRVLHDDSNVVLLLSNPKFKPRTVSAAVGMAQVARPTILKALGIAPRYLDAVRAEGTSVLPTVPS